MWLVLGATVGLAAIQVRQHPAPPHRSLSMRVHALGPFAIRVPEDWVASKPGDHVLEFHEPVNPAARTLEEAGGRELTVEQDLARGKNPTTYLLEKLDREVLPDSKLIPMCGQQGVMVAVPFVGDVEGTSIYAATVLPNGDAITIELSILRPLTLEDVELAETIAGTIMYKPAINKPPQRPVDIQKPERPEVPDDGD